MNSNISDRVRLVNDKPVNEEGEFVLYWMIATRRYNYNASLQFPYRESQVSQYESHRGCDYDKKEECKVFRTRMQCSVRWKAP